MGKWQRVSSEVVYTNPFYTVEKDVVIKPDGTQGGYSVVRKKPYVAVAAVHDDGRIYFIKQFRYPTQREGYELIMGGCDGEEPLVAAKRELREEAGLMAEHWEELGEIDTASSFCDEIGYVFMATGLVPASGHAQEEEGITECIPLGKAAYNDKIMRGEIRSAATIAVLYLAAQHVDKSGTVT